MGLAILALAVGGFAIGTTEFMTMGVLPQVAAGVGVSIPSAGHAISAYALGVVVGVPLLSLTLAGRPRRAVLIGLMLAYALGNLGTALAQTYGELVVARFLDGLPHGAYFGVASLVASQMSQRRGRAVAMVMMGLSVANVLGVPAATWLGEHAGWRATYVSAALLALVTAAMVRAFVPRLAPQPEASLRAEASGFFRSVPVWLTLVASAGGFAGMFAVYSYIARIVTDVAHLPESDTPWYVLAYGIGMIVGTWLAGELTHWSVFGTLLLGTGGSVVALLCFWWAAPVPWLLLLMCFVVSLLASLLAIGFQLRLMEAAHGAENLGAAMNHAALNVANALGAWMGGVVITAGYGYRAPALVGACAAFFGLVMVVVAVAYASRNRFAASAGV